ncbi:MAG: dihydropteroate synthase [Acidobacteriota bacterium]
MIWQTSRRKLPLERTLVMAILNVTPDSFSDGGKYLSVDDALWQVEKMVAQGADIIDIGGESTRPGSSATTATEEIGRTIPVIEAIRKRFDTPISIDTTKADVAERAVDAGAEIINDISGLRFDERIADIAAASKAGLVLMHSRGSFETLHSQPPVDDIMGEVTLDLNRAIKTAKSRGVAEEQIVLDVGIGFGKTQEQNLELLAKLGNIVDEFKAYPMLVGASRKSFIGKVAGDAPLTERLGGSLAAAILAVRNGAAIIRVHDVKETVAAIKVAAAIKENQRS